MKQKESIALLARFCSFAYLQLPVVRLSASKEAEENTSDQPLKLTPGQEQYINFAQLFEIEFKPYSLAVLRIKKQ